MTIKSGQIWREVDRRFNRYIQVVDVTEGAVRPIKIATIDLATNALGRKTWASRERFSGKYGGYELYRDAK
ncbi:hypothetical protein F0160_22590 [Paraburkholderia sp. JPY303]|uniref:hypothetical protein n=1 Tax=Paraburkholderia atlantica TaxID=2654982 RepID=UPI001591AEE0|nr:hypothetical protein [Paraburkholderia atlantica]NUY33276.1 hypothetical protein [Paraburkholderia atlantica]